MENIFYVYALLDTRKPGHYRYGHWVFNFEPFYIGKGHGKRVDSHFYPTALKGRGYKANKVRKILSETGDFPICVIKKRNLSEQEAFNLECRLISIIGRGKDGPLTNCTDGGDGASGRKVVNSTRIKASNSVKSFYKNLPKKSLYKKVAKWKDTVEKRSAKKKVEIANSIKQGWASRSAKKQKEFSRKRSEIQKSVMANRTTSEQKKVAKNLSKGVSSYWNTLTDKEYNERCAAQVKCHAKRSKRRKDEIHSKISASISRYHQQSTIEEKAAKADKIRNTLKNMDPIKRIRLNAGIFVRNRLKKLGLLYSNIREELMDLVNSYKFTERNFDRFTRKMENILFTKGFV